MFFKVTLGVWLISTLIFFYFFIFDSSKESDASRAADGRRDDATESPQEPVDE